MIEVQLDRTINRPIQQVFEHLTDIERYPQWMPRKSILRDCTQDSPGSVGQGTLYTDKTSFGTVHGEVAAYQAPTRVVFHYAMRWFGRTVMEGWPGYTLERAGSARTVVHHHAKARLWGPLRLLQPIIQHIANNERRRTIDALKTALESGSMEYRQGRCSR